MNTWQTPIVPTQQNQMSKQACHCETEISFRKNFSCDIEQRHFIERLLGFLWAHSRMSENFRFHHQKKGDYTCNAKHFTAFIMFCTWLNRCAFYFRRRPTTNTVLRSKYTMLSNWVFFHYFYIILKCLINISSLTCLTPKDGS